MRSVAKFKLLHAEADKQLFDQVVAVLRTWFEGKLLKDGADGYRIRRDGRAAVASFDTEEALGARLLQLQVTEAVPGGHLTTKVSVLERSDVVHFSCDLGVVASGVSRPTIALRAPKFVQGVVAIGTAWQIERGRDRIFSFPFAVGINEIKQFEDLIRSADRALPVIAVSKFDGKPAFPGLASELAKRVTGLAHVCVLSEDASWHLTETLGGQWSCFNGAVRIYWPGGVGEKAPLRHPLWLPEGLEHRWGEGAQDWLCDRITQRVIEASSYLSSNAVFDEFEELRAKARLEAAERQAADESDYQQLAEIYATENKVLKDKNKALLQQIENANVELIGLRSAYFSGELASDVAEGESLEAPPSTVLEAVLRARSQFGSNLIFADGLDGQLETLNSSAGPPAKIFAQISVLNDLANALDAGDGNIGMSIPVWMKSRNVDCSVESSTIKKNKLARNARTFQVSGEDFYCEFHLKPSDGTSPDKCVRIYFGPSESKPYIRVGYVGRHF